MQNQNIRKAINTRARIPTTTPMAILAPVERPLEVFCEAGRGVIPGGRADGVLEELESVGEVVVPDRVE